jgi:CRP-like cAMP-binding protein
MVLQEGDHPTAVHCVYSGTLILFRVGRQDEEVVLRLVQPGDVIGYRALVAGEPLAASARAAEDATTCAITKGALLHLIRTSPELTMQLMAKLATELRVSEDLMVSRVLETVAQRVARFLVWMQSGLSMEVPASQAIRIPIRRNEMADVIGTTPETLSRILHDFDRRGIVVLERQIIHVRRPELLNRIASEGR